MSEAAIRLSPYAAMRAAATAARHATPYLTLRLAVDGGGCAGFQYKFGLESEAADDDLVGEAEAILEARAAAAVDGEAQDRGLALPLGDRRDAGRGGGRKGDVCALAHALRDRRRGRVPQALEIGGALP